MSPYDPRSLLEKLLGAAVTLLLIAFALHWAVGLFMDVWRPLLVLVGIGLAVTVLVAVWSGWRNRW